MRAHIDACRNLPAVLAGITSSNPFGLGSNTTAKDTEGKQLADQGSKTKDKKDIEAASSHSSTAAQKEQRHRKDDAAGRSREDGGDHHGAKDKDKQGHADPSKGHRRGHRHNRAGEAVEHSRAKLASTAKELAGIWKEINEEAKRRDSSDEDERDAQPSSREPEAPEQDAAPVARIVAYSDSDSDEPLPHLPFQKQRDKPGEPGQSEAEAGAVDSSQAESAPGSRRLWLPWRGAKRPADLSEVSRLCALCVHQAQQMLVISKLQMTVDEVDKQTLQELVQRLLSLRA